AGETVDRRARDVDAAFPVAAEILSPGLGPRTNHGAEIEASRVGRDERLWEQHEPGAFARRLPGEIVQFCEGALPVERDRGGLDDGNGNRGCGYGHVHRGAPDITELLQSADATFVTVRIHATASVSRRSNEQRRYASGRAVPL